MFCKVRNSLIMMLSLLFAYATSQANAQGLVSLSEEAMFDDELETNRDIPSLDTSSNQEKATTSETNTPPEVASVLEAPKVELKVAEKEVQPNNVFAAPVVSSAPNPVKDVVIDEPAVVSNDLFSQMSDIEKRTALLNLELRREKLQNEIEAVKNQRRQALIQEEEKAEALRLKNLEFEKEQERKVLVEQEKLRELDIAFETLRQEKILSSYKNQMLEEHQKWIDHNANFYRQIADIRESKEKLVKDMNEKMKSLKKAAEDARMVYNAKVDAYAKENKDLQSQISVLRKRIETVEKERDSLSLNPFAGVAAGGTVSVSTGSGDAESVDLEPVENDLTKLYAVTEIRGQGGELVAKLINKNGTPFYVKKGTALQTGHTIGDITSTYVTADRGDERSYLYFAAGGILPSETTKFEISEDSVKDRKTK